MTIIIRRPITIKAIVTEELKEKLAYDLQKALEKIEQDLEQIDFHGKRYAKELQKEDPKRLEVFQQQIMAEKQKRLEHKQDILDKLKKVAALQLGQEVIQGQVEGEYEVAVGDDWNEIMNAEIVVKDGKVIEIRAK